MVRAVGVETASVRRGAVVRIARLGLVALGLVARGLLALVAQLALVGCSPGEPLPDAAQVDAPVDTLQQIGGACTDHDDCRAGLECFTGPPDARVWPEGYCTRACETDDDCTGGARCASAYQSAQGPVLRCLAPCERVAGERGGCREGYTCFYDGLCTLGCVDDEQCVQRDTDPPGGRAPRSPGATCEVESGRCILGATADARHGDTCVESADCGPTSACFGGRCLNVQCDLGGDRACPDDAVCIPLPLPYGTSASLCTPRCQPGVDGRNGTADACMRDWACQPPESSLADPSTGYCFPGFGPPNSVTTFGSCTTSADCANPLGFSHCDPELRVCVALYCMAASLSAVPELACPPGGVCQVVEPSDMAGGQSPADQRLLSLGLCVGEAE